MAKVIAIYGKTCSLKSDVAREISRFTGYKVKHPGEMATTYARAAKLDSALKVPEDKHRAIDEDTLKWVNTTKDSIIIIESTLLDAVLKGINEVFFARLHSRDDVRKERWAKRREEGGGRSRQIGEGVEQRDKDDMELRTRLYGAEAGSRAPDLELDTSESPADHYAREIWAAFQHDTVAAPTAVTAGKPAMDKAQKKGIRPGASSGVVKVYSANRNPFGGYITDDKSHRDIFIHKSAVQESGIDKLEKGQRVEFDIVEDGFGSFKAVKVRQSG
ncbi:MAG: cold shock domain-containing protein [Acidiferrobacterales bacterium]